MKADYMMKPFVGSDFLHNPDWLLNLPSFTQGQQECVGDYGPDLLGTDDQSDREKETQT